MGKARSSKGMQLKFGTITCGRCGGERLLARTCPDCGERPKVHEVQYELQRRERVVADFRSRREVPDHAIAPDTGSLDTDFGRSLNGVLRALSDASRSSRTADALVAAFGDMDQLVASWGNQLPRPQRNRGKTIGRALGTFAQGVELFVDALSAPDIHAAQEIAQRGNQLIREAEDVLEEIGELNAAEETFASGSPVESLNRIGREARLSVGWESTVAELDANLSSGVSWDAALPGMGLQSRTILLMAQSLFDLEEFVAVIGVADKATTAGSFALAESDEWQRAHARAAAYLAGGAMTMHHAITADGSSELEVAHSAASAVTTWRDGVLRHTLATLLASSIDEYNHLVGKSGGHVAKKAASAHPDLLLNENLAPALRNAGGHAGVDLAEDGLRIGDEKFTIDNFLDRVLAYFETTMATFVGVTLAMTRLGADLSNDAYLAPRDRHAAVALFLGTYDLDCVAVHVESDALTIQASGPEPDWMTLAAALSAIFPDSVERAQIRLSTGHGERTFTTSFERFRQYADGIGELPAEQAALHFSAIAAASRLDSASPWPQEDWNRVVQAVTRRSDGLDLRAWVKAVRKLRDFGVEAGQPHVVTQCESALAELRR